MKAVIAGQELAGQVVEKEGKTHAREGCV